RDAEQLLEGRGAREHFGAAVVPDAGRELAGFTFELVLAGAVMDHDAHPVVDDDELIDAGAAAIAVARVGAGAVNLGACRSRGREPEKLRLVFPGRIAN